MPQQFRTAVRPPIAGTLGFICLIYSDQIRISAQINQSFDVARYAFRAVQNVSQLCHIEKDSISRSGRQSKIRRSESQHGRAFSARPEAALPARYLQISPVFQILLERRIFFRFCCGAAWRCFTRQRRGGNLPKLSAFSEHSTT